MSDDDFWAKRCDELKDEIERLRNPWQDISTAPKDGTEVIIANTQIEIAVWAIWDVQCSLWAGWSAPGYAPDVWMLTPPSQKEGG